MTGKWKAAFAAVLAASAGAAAAGEASYPARPVRWVVPFTPGASNDIIAHPAFPPRNPRELLDYAKANPGKVNLIGVANLQRLRLLPEVQTLAEGGIKDAEAIVWFGMSGPAKLPRALVEKLNAQINKTLALPDVKRRLDQLGLEVAGGRPEAFDAFVKKEAGKVARLIKAGLLKTE